MRQERWARILSILPIILFCLGLWSDSYAFKLPDTGQTLCYDSSGIVIECVGTGQDGEYNINPMSYTDNGDGTVTDNNTGLMWQQQDDGIPYNNWYIASGTYDATYNPTPSQNVCSLTLGGYSDWRLPTKKELITIVDYSIPSPGPTINPVFTNTKQNFPYWSSTTYAEDPTGAWDVDFYNGSVYYGFKSGGSADYRYVRCVRGGKSPGPNLIDNGDGTVTDTRAGLMWQKGEPGDMKWDSALSYCNGLFLTGQSDWRLPNIKELESITDDSRHDPAIDISFFPNFFPNYDDYYPYWSATTSEDWTYAALVVFFDDGSVGSRSKDPYAYHKVRCVRRAFENLAISKDGAGTGTVVSGPPGINCDLENTACNALFLTNTVVTLSAIPAQDGSIFIGWSDGDCSDGKVTMSGDIACTAAFEHFSTPPAEINGTPYYSIGDAYLGASSDNNDLIKLVAYNRVETVDFKMDKNIILKGGYDGYLSWQAWLNTFITGTLTISYGSVTIENIVITGTLTISGGSVTIENIVIQ